MTTMSPLATPVHAETVAVPMPRLIVAASDAQAFVQSMHADLARLALELRQVSQLAAELDADHVIDLRREEQASAERVVQRRAELELELEEETHQASTLVAAAKAEADAIREAGRVELLEFLHRSTDWTPQPPPPPPSAAPWTQWAPPAPQFPTAPPYAVHPSVLAAPASFSEPMAQTVPAKRQSRLRTLVFLDVALPLIAVVAVFAVLLAWLG